MYEEDEGLRGDEWSGCMRIVIGVIAVIIFVIISLFLSFFSIGK